MTAPWRAGVLSLFPEMFPGPLGHSLAGRALERGLWALEARDIRAFATDRHRTVDDTPFGGGAGMVMRPDILDAALASLADGRPAICLTPRGRPLTQDRVRRLAAGPGVVLLCGRYEGIDQRVIDARALEEISIGDYVLSGGEPAAMVLLDACVRLLPGVMGAAASAEEESFAACSPATTRRSPTGAAPRRSGSPASAAPTCGPPIREPSNQDCAARRLPSPPPRPKETETRGPPR